MAGITDHPFRVLCREMGAGVVYTEFVSANGIIRENMKTLSLMKFTEEERPIGIQLFGEIPEVVGKSAKIVFGIFKKCFEFFIWRISKKSARKNCQKNSIPNTSKVSSLST